MLIFTIRIRIVNFLLNRDVYIPQESVIEAKG